MQKRIFDFYEQKNFKALKNELSACNEVDIAEIFDECDSKMRVVCFRLLPKDMAAGVFVELDDDAQKQLIEQFSDSELSEVINELYVDDAADIIEEMPANVVRRILKQTEPEMRKMINEVLKFPDDSAGSIMNTEFVTLKPHMSVADALLHIRKTGRDMETVATLYVVTSKQRLLGIVDLGQLIFASPDTEVESLMESSGIIKVQTTDDQESVALLSQKYSLDVIPVVDGENRLVGIVTSPDLTAVLTEEATEDIEVMAAITPQATPYLKQSVFSIFKSRVPWLLILMLSATFTSIIISSFENALAVIPILSAFIPMLMGTGGNAGAQASATVIRGLSLEEIRLRDVFRVILKELRVSALCGACLAVAMFIKMLTLDRLIMGSEVSALVALTVCITLFLTVIFAKIIGGLLPLFAKRVGVDPAVMASPFITTLTDTITLLVYFVIAINVLNI